MLGLSRRRRTHLQVEELEGRVVPALLGKQLFPADYPWNQNISNAPVAVNSAAVITHIGSTIRLHPDWGEDDVANGTDPLYGVPYNVVHGNDPNVTKIHVIIDNYPDESDLLLVPFPANVVLEGDFQNGPNPNGGGYEDGQRGDSHLIIWDQDNNIAYELYGVTRPSDPFLFPDDDGVMLPHTDGLWHAAQQTVWNMNTNSFRTLGDTSADAAGLSLLAGLARPDEGLPVSQGGQGAINHALRFTLPSAIINPQYIYPASHVVNTSLGTAKLPFGARLRLMNTPAVNTLINSMGPQAQIIARAMQQYGLVLADIGSSMFITGTSAAEDTNNIDSLTWNMDDVLGLKSLTAGYFQVVDLTPQVTGVVASNGAAGNTVTIVGKNFSGAAGHLTVLFGGTTATSVTFVDDSHITAVVPNGSGTVHVQVVSGVTRTDPNNPARNVTNPVFGYGISATTSADLFTYGTAMPHAANSTVAVAAPSLVSGTTSTVTLVVKNSAGGPISGLTSAAFSISVSGGTSSGTVSAVTETAVPGTYQATFTGVTAGSASVLTATVSGAVLTTKPTIRVTVGAVSAATSTVSFAAPTVASGTTLKGTITVKDAAGNLISGLGAGAFSLALSGGASTGTFSAVSEKASPGSYKVIFTGALAGTSTTLRATVKGVLLNSAPTISVTPGAVHGGKSTVSVTPSSVVLGNTATVTIVVKDKAGNLISGLTPSAFLFALSVGTSKGSFGAVTETSTQGTYTATFTSTKAGTARLLTTTISGVVLVITPKIRVMAAVSAASLSADFASERMAFQLVDLDRS